MIFITCVFTSDVLFRFLGSPVLFNELLLTMLFITAVSLVIVVYCTSNKVVLDISRDSAIYTKKTATLH